MMKDKKFVVAVFFFAALFLSIAFYSSATFRHQAHPVTQDVIDKEPDATKRAFLLEVRKRDAAAIESSKSANRRNALLSFAAALGFGLLYVSLTKTKLRQAGG